jgi:hypothetical protein
LESLTSSGNADLGIVQNMVVFAVVGSLDCF